MIQTATASPVLAEPRGTWQGTLQRFVRNRYPEIILVFLFIGASFGSPAFLSTANLQNLVSQLSVIGLVVLAELIVVIAGGIDISVGSILALSAVFSAGFFDGSSVLVGLAVGVGTGLVLGALNGSLVAFRGVDAFIVTLGTMALARGFVYAYTEGSAIAPADPNFTFIGTQRFLGFPLIGLVWILVAIAMAFVLRRTLFGRRVFAVGSSKPASAAAGINVNSTTFWVFVIAGGIVGLGGFLLTSRVGAGTPTAGMSYELDAIAAVVIGGASLSGGRGRASGAVIGAVVFGIISNLLILMNVSTFWQDALKGALILVAVAIAAGRRGGATAS